MNEFIEGKYLSRELKKYYMEDFQRVLSLNHSVWGINSEELEEILKLINSNEEVQTIFSNHYNKIGTERSSYIEFAFTKEGGNIIMKLRDHLEINFKQNFNFYFCGPKDNPLFNKEEISKFDIGCHNNPDYFRINHIIIWFENANFDIHVLFLKNIRSFFENKS